MAKTKHPPEQIPNGFEDEDFRTVLSELDEMDDEAESIMASARGKVSGIRKRQKNRIKIADKELNIPPALIRGVRAQRKLERQMLKVVENLPDDLIDVFEDSAGQFSLFAPAQGEAPVETSAQSAARQRRAEIAKVTAEEQIEGAAALDDLTTTH